MYLNYINIADCLQKITDMTVKGYFITRGVLIFMDQENLKQEGLLLLHVIVLPISVLLGVIIINSSIILNCF